MCTYLAPQCNNRTRQPYIFQWVLQVRLVCLGSSFWQQPLPLIFTFQRNCLDSLVLLFAGNSGDWEQCSILSWLRHAWTWINPPFFPPSPASAIHRMTGWRMILQPQLVLEWAFMKAVLFMWSSYVLTLTCASPHRRLGRISASWEAARSIKAGLNYSWLKSALNPDGNKKEK